METKKNMRTVGTRTDEYTAVRYATTVQFRRKHASFETEPIDPSANRSQVLQALEGPMADKTTLTRVGPRYGEVVVLR